MQHIYVSYIFRYEEITKWKYTKHDGQVNFLGGNLISDVGCPQGNWLQIFIWNPVQWCQTMTLNLHVHVGPVSVKYVDVVRTIIHVFQFPFWYTCKFHCYLYWNLSFRFQWISIYQFLCRLVSTCVYIFVMHTPLIESMTLWHCRYSISQTYLA